ncbi:hypothetical protein M5D96_013865 [Drosophila gunungcola]|uniref:Uncharacterized protein n=1 Tax=Drosophila gunungcola TaxID=103775 RepID=A0A9P9YAH6_9MUSC|nr:hypothetical protein M5D96_013865 [Drosophila gunungcola]
MEDSLSHCSTNYCSISHQSVPVVIHLTINCKVESKTSGQRDQWGKGVEFPISCIALSVGLGNVWRFPFIALEKGEELF